MLHDDVIAFIFEWNSEIGEEGISRLPHDHGGEELAAKPSTTSWGDGSLDNSDLQVRAGLAKHVSSAETAGAGPDDDDVGLSVGVEVLEVTTRHGARDLGLADGREGEPGVPLVRQFLEGLGLLLAGRDGDSLDGVVLLRLNDALGRGGLGKHGGGGRHDC